MSWSIADMVRAMHDIDSMQGKCCGTCMHLSGHTCLNGMDPYGEADGCEKWRWDQTSRIGLVAPAVKAEKTHQRPSNERGGPS